MPIKRAVIALLLGLLTLQPGLADGFDYSSWDHSDWDQLLKRHVIAENGGRASVVNYAAMARDQPQLKRYLTHLAGVSQQVFDTWTAPTQLAFLINTYNAWTIELILTEYPDIKSIKEIGGFFGSPWSREFIPLFGETHSLNHIEHNLIRESGRYNDPRIHFAVNCASIGCPALRPEAYIGEQLDTQLEDQTRRFLSDRSRNRLEGKTLKLSPIFKWFRKDFELGWLGIDSMEAFLVRYAQPLGMSSESVAKLHADQLGIDFLNYDWALNAYVR